MSLAAAAVERAMKRQEVIMRALSGSLAPSEVKIACRVLDEQAHHEIPDVKLRPAALRDLGNT